MSGGWGAPLPHKYGCMGSGGEVGGERVLVRVEGEGSGVLNCRGGLAGLEVRNVTLRTSGGGWGGVVEVRKVTLRTCTCELSI
jgi:hypothetical protein